MGECSSGNGMPSTGPEFEPYNFEYSLSSARVYQRSQSHQTRQLEHSNHGQMSIVERNDPVHRSHYADESLLGSTIQGDCTETDDDDATATLRSFQHAAVDSETTLRPQISSDIVSIIGSAAVSAFQKACEHNNREYVSRHVPAPPSGVGFDNGWRTKTEASFYLCTAAQKSPRILGFLLSTGWAEYINEPAVNSSSALDVALQFGNGVALNMLLDYGANIYQYEPLRGYENNLSAQGSFRALQKEIQDWACRQNHSGSMIHILGWRWKLEHVMQLIEESAQSLGDKLKWNDEFVQFLERYVMFSEQQRYLQQTPIDYAVLRGNVSALRNLSLWNADLSCPDQCGRTPLHQAIKYNSIPSFDFLLSCNLPIDLKDHEGRQPIHDAVIWDREEMLRKLMTAGASTSCEDNAGATPVHLAARSKKMDVIRQMTFLNVDWCCKDPTGQQPIHYAAANNNDRTVGFLVAQGAFLFDEDDRGYTPAHLAVLGDAIDVLYFIGEDGSNWEGGFFNELLQFAKEHRKLKAKFLIEAMIRAQLDGTWRKSGLTPITWVKTFFLSMTTLDQD